MKCVFHPVSVGELAYVVKTGRDFFCMTTELPPNIHAHDFQSGVFIQKDYTRPLVQFREIVGHSNVALGVVISRTKRHS